MFQQARARRGEDHPASIALEEIVAQFDLQLPHVAAQGGLHHRQKSGGAREAAEFCHVAKILQLFQIHGSVVRYKLCENHITDIWVIHLKYT